MTTPPDQTAARPPVQASATASASPDWTTRTLLEWMRSAFTKAQLDSPKLCAEILLAHVIGCERLRLYMDADRQASADEREKLRSLVGRALRHEPIQYLVGEWWFYGLAFAVDQRVLIPRPSTETLVELALDHLRSRAGEARSDGGDVEIDVDEPVYEPSARAPSPGVAAELEFVPESEPEAGAEGEPEAGDDAGEQDTAAAAKAMRAARAAARVRGPVLTAVDLCAGSGCVAVSIAHRRPTCRVIAVDVSSDALEVAKANAERHGVGDRVVFIEGDVRDPGLYRRLASYEWLSEHGGADMVVSNPPYIPDAEWAEVAANVRDYEPELALRGGADGLDLVRPIVAGATALVAPGGLLAVEVATSHCNTAAALLKARADLAHTRILDDGDGLPRVIAALRA